MWDLTAGKLLHDFKFHEGHIRSIDFHPLEFLLATGEWLYSVYIRLKLSNSVIDIKLALHVSWEIVRDILGSIFQGIHNSLSYSYTSIWNLFCLACYFILSFLFLFWWGKGEREMWDMPKILQYFGGMTTVHTKRERYKRKGHWFLLISYASVALLVISDLASTKQLV